MSAMIGHLIKSPIIWLGKPDEPGNTIWCCHECFSGGKSDKLACEADWLHFMTAANHFARFGHSF